MTDLPLLTETMQDRGLPVIRIEAFKKTLHVWWEYPPLAFHKNLSYHLAQGSGKKVVHRWEKDDT